MDWLTNTIILILITTWKIHKKMRKIAKLQLCIQQSQLKLILILIKTFPIIKTHYRQN
jgi:hypothetical protein